MEGIKLEAYKLLSFDKITSTQDYAHDLIAKGSAKNKMVITALTQTAGRGKYRRTWVSRRGNLYASFILKSPERDPRLAYAIGVAVSETLISFGLEPQIKWPNDVLIDGKKISGTLIEYADNFVIVGIGININSCPNIKEYQTTKMNKYAKVEVKDVLNVLMKKIDKWHNADFVIVRDRWMILSSALNKIIKYHGKPAEIIGLNEDGGLVLRDGEKYILTYGDEISI
ncbi:MAG: biotin--[Alphaproteobacteria bacterium]|nr:biotin--[acetyl-CoA-carboxylase] ligase [Alphaproteobacteria bacterium]